MKGSIEMNKMDRGEKLTVREFQRRGAMCRLVELPSKSNREFGRKKSRSSIYDATILLNTFQQWIQ